MWNWKEDENTFIEKAEPIENVVKRVLEFIDLIKKSDDKNILVVTHSGVLYALYKHITKTGLGVRPKEIYFHNCCSVYLNIDNDKLELIFKNKVY